MKRFFATCFLLPLQLVFGEGEAGPVVALVTEPPAAGCYQLVEVVDAAGQKINEAAPGEVVRLRSTFKNLSERNILVAKRTTAPWTLSVEYICHNLESWKAALGRDHPRATKESFEDSEGVLNPFDTGFSLYLSLGSADKEWIFLHRTPPARAMICGCVEWERSYRSFKDIQLDPTAWDECKITFTRLLKVMEADNLEPRGQDGEIILRIQRKAVDAAAGQPEAAASARSGRFQILQESGGNSKETVVFNDPAIPPVELPAYQWPGEYSISPDGEWLLRFQREDAHDFSMRLYRVEANGRVSEVNGFDALVRAAIPRNRESFKWKTSYQSDLGVDLWSEDGLQLAFESTHTDKDGKREETRIRYNLRDNRAKVFPVPTGP